MKKNRVVLGIYLLLWAVLFTATVYTLSGGGDLGTYRFSYGNSNGGLTESYTISKCNNGYEVKLNLHMYYSDPKQAGLDEEKKTIINADSPWNQKIDFTKKDAETDTSSNTGSSYNYFVKKHNTLVSYYANSVLNPKEIVSKPVAVLKKDISSMMLGLVVTEWILLLTGIGYLLIRKKGRKPGFIILVSISVLFAGVLCTGYFYHRDYVSTDENSLGSFYSEEGYFDKTAAAVLQNEKSSVADWFSISDNRGNVNTGIVNLTNGDTKNSTAQVIYQNGSLFHRSFDVVINGITQYSYTYKIVLAKETYLNLGLLALLIPCVVLIPLLKGKKSRVFRPQAGTYEIGKQVYVNPDFDFLKEDTLTDIRIWEDGSVRCSGKEESLQARIAQFEELPKEMVTGYFSSALYSGEESTGLGICMDYTSSGQFKKGYLVHHICQKVISLHELRYKS